MAEERESSSGRILNLFIVFMVILGVALYGLNSLSDRREKSMREVTIERMNEVEDALAEYLVDTLGVLPTTKQGLSALVVKPENGSASVAWRGPYVSSPEVLKDAWGHEFGYICPGRPIRGHDELYDPYSLWSYGADDAEGGTGENADVLSWNRTTMIP